MIKNSCSLSNKFKYSFILNYRAVGEETWGDGGKVVIGIKINGIGEICYWLNASEKS